MVRCISKVRESQKPTQEYRPRPLFLVGTQILGVFSEGYPPSETLVWKLWVSCNREDGIY